MNAKTVTAPSLQTELSLGDNLIGDIEQLVHTIQDANDPDTIECKDNYNEALIHNKEVQTLHKKLEDETQIDEEKLEEMKRNYNPTSEKYSIQHGICQIHKKTTISSKICTKTCQI